MLKSETNGHSLVLRTFLKFREKAEFTVFSWCNKSFFCSKKS
jgi:hypothetical protein